MADNNPTLSRLSQVAGTQSQQQGTGYTNLGRILQANQGNQLGQAVAGNVQQQIGGVQNQLNQQQQQFQTESEKNKVGTDADKANRDSVINRFSTTQQDSAVGSGRSDATASTPPSTTTPSSGTSAIAPTKDDTSAFQRYMSGTYSGPQGLADTSGLSTTASQLKNQVSNFTPAGTQELLRRSVGGVNYNQGQQQLDTMLMGQSPGAQQSLTQAQRQASGLGQLINRANLAASGTAESNKNLAQQFATETQDKLNAGLTGIDTSVQGQLKAAQDAENTRLANIQSIQNFTNNKTAKLDASGNVVKDVYGNVVYDTSANPRGTGTTFDQASKLKGLLSGVGANSDELSQIFGNNDISAAGNQYQSDLSNFNNRQGLQSNLTSKLSSAMDTLDNLTFQSQRTTQARNIARGILASNPAYASMGITENQLMSSMNGGRNPNQFNSLIMAGASDPTNQFTSSNGLVGKALAGGQQEALYSNLAKTLANSQAAQNLTAQGVASDAQRQSYLALNKLLGQQDSSSKYQTDAEKYQAGKLLLNPDVIKNSLGY